MPREYPLDIRHDFLVGKADDNLVRSIPSLVACNRRGDGVGLFGRAIADSDFSGNVAVDNGGAIAQVGSDMWLTTRVTLTDTWFDSNSADKGGALFASGYGVGRASFSMSCNSPGAGGMHANTATTAGGGAYLQGGYDSSASFSVSAGFPCDLGDRDSVDDNAPADIYTYEETWGGWLDTSSYLYGDGRTFSCTNYDGCDATDDFTEDWGNQDHDFGGAGRARGNIILADDTYILDDFSFYLDPASACTSVDLYVLSSSDLASWTEEYSATYSADFSHPAFSSLGPGWVKSGADMGVTTTSGVYYALMAAWTCTSEYFAERNTSDTAGGFGTIYGYVYSNSYAGTLPSSLGVSSYHNRYKTTVNYR